MKETEYISQTKLDTLQEDVCRPISYLATKIDSATPLWDGPIKMCQQIEADAFSVNSVVMEARKFNGYFNGVNTPRFYHAILCRVYILLYYYHHNEVKYKEIVFQKLKTNIGGYYNQNLTKINEQINKILEQEKLVKTVQAERKKDVKPVFAYVGHNGDERDILFIEYSEELLFRSMMGTIKELIEGYRTDQDVANVWFNAKQVVHTLRDINRPELLIERAAIALMNGQMNNRYEGSQIVLLCVYAMIRASENNAHFASFIEMMESLYNPNKSDMWVISQEINGIKSRIDNQTFDGYDYIGEQPTKAETYTEADIKRLQEQIQAKEEEKRLPLTKLIEDLQKQVSDKDALLQAAAKKDETELPDVQELPDVLYNKVAYEFFIRLLENAGFDLNDTGNKTEAGNLWHMVTGKSADDLRRYCSTRKYKNVKTTSDIKRLNDKLSNLGMTTILLGNNPTQNAQQSDTKKIEQPQ